MVEVDKPPKDKAQASDSDGGEIDQYDPLFLHSNDISGLALPYLSIITSLMYYVSKIGNGNTAFVARTNPRNNNLFGSNNQPRKLNRPNLVCTHCNMNGHTANRCFKLVKYHPKFKRNTSTNKGSASNNVVLRNKDQSAISSNSFTDDQYKRLMALISDKSGSSSMRANIADVSKLNMTVGHPNGIKALVTHVGSRKLTDKIVIYDILVVPGYQVSLLSMHRLSEDNKLTLLENGAKATLIKCCIRHKKCCIIPSATLFQVLP
ncbi:hypothetical protein Tco_1362296 [Tanacetum coccineum]